MTEQTEAAEVRVSEATSAEAREMCLLEIARAVEADSLDHMVMHLESAVIWARGADWPATAARGVEGGAS